MKRIIAKLYSKLPVLLFDTIAIPIAWYVAYWLRYNMQPFPTNLTSAYSLIALGMLGVVQLSCYYYFKVYRGLWRYASLNDVVRIIRAVITATFIVIPAFYLTSILSHIPRSVLPLYSIILVTMLCGARLSLRQYWDHNNRSGEVLEIKRVLIVGAGQAGEGLVRDLKRTSSYVPVGLIDDAANKRGLEAIDCRA